MDKQELSKTKDQKLKTQDWLPYKDNDSRFYNEITDEEKLLRHVESINKNIRFFA